MKKKKGQTQEEFFNSFVNKSYKMMADLRRNLSHLQAEVKKTSEESHELVTNIYKEFKSHGHLLQEIARVNSISEETMTNVLLAIRQNEYLQAWYPEQHGYPEMKVTGIHPAKGNKREAV